MNNITISVKHFPSRIYYQPGCADAISVWTDQPKDSHFQMSKTCCNLSLLFPQRKYVVDRKCEITKPQKESKTRKKEDHALTNKLDPVISSGWPSPMTSSNVGATSPRTPCCFLRVHPAGALAITKGTLLVVWDVLGFPCSLSISSALLF